MQSDDYRLKGIPFLEGRGEEAEVESEVRAMCTLFYPAKISYLLLRAKTSIEVRHVRVIAVGNKRIPGFLGDTRVLYYVNHDETVFDKGVDSVELRHLIDLDIIVKD